MHGSHCMVFYIEKQQRNTIRGAHPNAALYFIREQRVAFLLAVH